MYRSIDTETWTDPWFEELAPPAKLVFLYLITNHHVTSAGTCEMTLRRIESETGLTQAKIEALIPALAPRVLWWPEHRILWVRNFYRRQKANTNPENFVKGAARVVANLPTEVKEAICAQYPELSFSTPKPPKASRKHGDASGTHQDASMMHPDGIPIPSVSHPPSHPHAFLNSNSPETGTETEKTQREEMNHSVAAKPPVRVVYLPAFEVFWKAYGKFVGKKEAHDCWKKLAPDTALFTLILAAVEGQRAGRKWREGYQPDAVRWLKGEHWNDAIEEPRPAATVTPLRAGRIAQNLENLKKLAEEENEFTGIFQRDGDADDGLPAGTVGETRRALSGGTR